MLLTKFHIIWPSVSEEKLFQKSTNKKQELPMAAMFVNRSKRNEQFPQMLPTMFRSIWPSASEQNIFRNQPIRNKNCLKQTMLANGSGQNEQSLQRTFHRCFLRSFGSFGKVVSEGKIFQKSTNRKQELSVVFMFVNGSGRNEQL